jgi:hypothetical protein
MMKSRIASSRLNTTNSSLTQRPAEMEQFQKTCLLLPPYLSSGSISTPSRQNNLMVLSVNLPYHLAGPLTLNLRVVDGKPPTARVYDFRIIHEP